MDVLYSFSIIAAELSGYTDVHSTKCNEMRDHEFRGTGQTRTHNAVPSFAVELEGIHIQHTKEKNMTRALEASIIFEL